MPVNSIPTEFNLFLYKDELYARTYLTYSFITFYVILICPTPIVLGIATYGSKNDRKKYHLALVDTLYYLGGNWARKTL